MSVAIEITVSGLDEAIAKLARLSNPANRSRLMEALAIQLETQTRRRIESEKTAPDGSAWKPNIFGTSILYATGRNLRNSIASDASGDVASAWANFRYAGVHQFGATIRAKSKRGLRFATPGGFRTRQTVTIPARPFLGVSRANEAEIVRVTTDWIARVMQ